MAAGDTLRRITLQDQFIISAAGDLAGLKNPNANGADLRTDSLAQLLVQSGVPVILPSSGSSNATGQITLTTALPYQPSGTVQVWMPAGVVVGDATGGLYSATFSSTTVCQLAGAPTTANGAYAQVTTAVTLASLVVSGATMGLNGSLDIDPQWSFPNNANIKTAIVTFGGTTFSSLGSTTVVHDTRSLRIRNRGSQSVNNGVPGNATFTFLPVYGTVDTSVNQTLALRAQLAAATDYMILEGIAVKRTFVN